MIGHICSGKLNEVYFDLLESLSNGGEAAAVEGAGSPDSLPRIRRALEVHSLTLAYLTSPVTDETPHSAVDGNPCRAV